MRSARTRLVQSLAAAAPSAVGARSRSCPDRYEELMPRGSNRSRNLMAIGKYTGRSKSIGVTDWCSVYVHLHAAAGIDAAPLRNRGKRSGLLGGPRQGRAHRPACSVLKRMRSVSHFLKRLATAPAFGCYRVSQSIGEPNAVHVRWLHGSL